MKPRIRSLLILAFVFGFASCRETPSENSQEVDILESPEETTIEEVRKEADTSTVDSLQTDTLQTEEQDTLSTEQ